MSLRRGALWWLLGGLLVVAVRAQEVSLRRFENPVLRGYHADPTICRVGDDFYLATSSSEYFPGVPIYHSRDLVNWVLIGHALHRPEQIDLRGVENSKGIFAPTLRHHAGKFYLITTLVGAPARSGNFLLTATNPAGPWSDPIWLEDAPGIDPSLFFDADGRVYYCGNRRPETMLDPSHRVVWIQEIDLQTRRWVGPRTELDAAPLLANGTIGPAGWLEAPHLYRREGWYYLVVSHGGTWLDHAVSVWRSRQPLGPWEINPANPVLTHRGERPSGLTSVGHADLVETSAGDWWAVVLGSRDETGRSVMGRETFLVPVTWEAGWPVFNAAGRRGRVERFGSAPRLTAPASAGELAPAEAWVTIRSAPERWWSHDAGADTWRVQARPVPLTAAQGEPSALLRRVAEETCAAEATVMCAPKREGQRAGLTMLRARDAVWTLALERRAASPVVVAYRGAEELGAIELDESGPVRLRIALRDRRLEFAAALPGEGWRTIAADGAQALATSTAGRFTGAMVGLFAESPEPAEAIFRGFRVVVERPD